MLMGDRSKARNDPWNTRMSMDSVDMEPVGGSRHYRTDSESTVQEKSYLDQSYVDNPPFVTSVQRSNTSVTAHTKQISFGESYVSPPNNAYTQDPGPTPGFTNYNTSYNPYPQSQPHPGP
jgi:hypothetical protein